MEPDWEIVWWRENAFIFLKLLLKPNVLLLDELTNDLDIPDSLENFLQSFSGPVFIS